MNTTVDTSENDRTVYGQLCDSYRAIDDFRGKLLTLLPIGTGVFLVLPDLAAKATGQAQPGQQTQDFLATLPPVVGLFGMAVAAGLFALELYGIRKCTHLIEAGRALERRLNVTGQFLTRAPGLFGLISEPFAAGVIYPAVIAAWAYVALYTVPAMRGPWAAVALFAVAFLGSMAFIQWLRAEAEQLRNAELAQQELADLNARMGRAEQEGGPAAHELFTAHLSDQLIFRRASGKIVGKYGPDGFLAGLDSKPFKSRVVEDVTVSLMDDRALVTLIVVGTRSDDASVHRYRNVRLFSRAEGRWMLDLWYNYEIPEAKGRAG